MPHFARIPSRRAGRRPKALAAVPFAAMVALVALAAGCSPSHVPPTQDRARPAAVAAVASVATPAAARSGDACSVELYGDSILHGGYLGDRRLAETPAGPLKRLRPRYRVVDRTVNGETASARSASFAGEERSGRIVVIEHGLNDAMQGLPLESALRAMIAHSRAEGRHVVLTGLSRTLVGADVRARGDATVRRVARELAVPFADWGSVPVRPAEMADILHPAQAYSTRLVEHLVAVLDTLAPECV